LLFYRFIALNLALLAGTGLLLAGGPWAFLSLPLALGFVAAIDERIGDTRESFSDASAGFMNAQLYLTLPLLALLHMAYATMLSDRDPFGLIWLVNAVTSYDVAATRAATHPVLLALAVLPVGMFSGTAGINVAHELVHRLKSPLDLIIGRWLLAFSCDTAFAIEHVHGHHRNVGTPADPATARRNESIYAFILRSGTGSVVNTFRREATRLTNLRLPVWSWRNRALRGQLMSLTVAAGFVYAAGLTGLIAFLVISLIGIAYLETVNYIEHYGLVRVPGKPVEPRHSWDSYRAVSGFLLYNLPRHSDHHLQAHKPYWELKARAEAPLMPYGYQIMMAIAFVPSRFFKLMAPRLQTWDDSMANAEERDIVAGRTLTPAPQAGAAQVQVA
jgi:alkane 1-monooxygenase